MSLSVDINIVKAVEQYFKYGLPPGSCTTYMLQEKFADAHPRAHELIRRDDKIWNDHIKFIQDYLPACCKGQCFKDWKGYAYMSDEDKLEVDVMIRLSVKQPAQVQQWAKQTHNEFIA